MENSLENKQRFFAHYWGQKVLIHNNGAGIISSGALDFINYYRNISNGVYLELTPLSLISEDDAIELAKICSPKFNLKNFGRNKI